MINIHYMCVLFFCSGGLYSAISSPGNLSAAIIVTVKNITHLGPLQILTMNSDGVVSRTGLQRNKLCKMAKVNVIKVHEIVIKFEKICPLEKLPPKIQQAVWPPLIPGIKGSMSQCASVNTLLLILFGSHTRKTSTKCFTGLSGGPPSQKPMPVVVMTEIRSG